MTRQKVLKYFPSIDTLLQDERLRSYLQQISRERVKHALVETSQNAKTALIEGTLELPDDRQAISDHIIEHVRSALELQLGNHLKPVINATGIVLHTGLGRAPYSDAAKQQIMTILSGYCNLELDLETGKRGQRNDHVRELICELTGAEGALVVNNNAAAVFLSLNTLAAGREALISRGELIEIGGSFRMPDIMAKSGVIMHEVGTTNKTKLSDYERAINDQTGAVVVAHSSNYRIKGFTASVPLKELVELAHAHHLPLLHDLGGGVLTDLREYNLPYEPLVQDSIRAGADVITFSGDKILGGPQSGLIVGRQPWIDQLYANPITRAVRCDKLTYAALEATLKLMLNKEQQHEHHKTLHLLSHDPRIVRQKAEKAMQQLSPQIVQTYQIKIKNSKAQTGSGALPLETLDSYALVLSPANGSSDKLASQLRKAEPPVVGYIHKTRLVLDFRTVSENEIKELVRVLNQTLVS